MSGIESSLTERQKAILDFIVEFQRRKGLSPTHREICEHFGFRSYGTVHKHLRLLQSKGYLQRDWNQKRGLRMLRAIPPADDGSCELPFLGRIAAGRPIEAVANDESLAVPRHLLRSEIGEHYVLKVVGDSMIEEGIQDGDLVIVRRQRQADAGEMVVALVENEATLKRFHPEGDQVRLQPANPSMAPIRVAADKLEIQGIVVGLMRRF